MNFFTSAEYKNDLLKTLRDEQKLTQEEVARSIGVTRMMIWYAEKGIRVSPKTLRLLADFYKRPLSDFWQTAEKNLADFATLS